MKIIKVTDTIYDIRALYRSTKTPAQRALLGYMTKGGFTQNSIFGGAFHLLCAIERCNENERIYKLVRDNNVSIDMEKQIIYIAEAALQGEWDAFMVSEKEINIILKNLSEYL